MTQRIYVVADTHFGHSKVIQFESEYRAFRTIEAHDRELVARWNAVVRPKDTVWHLGDVFFGGRDKHGILSELHGIKRLVLGNHDTYPLDVYRQYFGKIFGAVELRGCILTHVPVHPSQLDTRYKANLHGHLHSNKLADPRYICVSLEQTKLAPMLLDEALSGIL